MELLIIAGIVNTVVFLLAAAAAVLSAICSRLDRGNSHIVAEVSKRIATGLTRLLVVMVLATAAVWMLIFVR